jgi:hypothetical protein
MEKKAKCLIIFKQSISLPQIRAERAGAAPVRLCKKRTNLRQILPPVAEIENNET